MSQLVVFLLLFGALLLPIVGAALLRLAWPRLDEARRAVTAALVFGLSFASLFVLAFAEVPSLRVAGLTIILPIAAPVEAELPDLPIAPDPTSPPAATLATGTPEPPTGTPEPPTGTPEPPTGTPEPPTATPEPPTGTPEPPTGTPEPPTATPEPPTATPEPAGPRRYTVQPGDTLRSIAEANGVTVAALLEANDLTPQQADTIRPGQELIIP